MAAITFYLWRSTLRAVEGAEGSVEEARRANTISEGVRDAEHRPWIAVVGAKVIRPIGFNRPLTTVVIDFTLTNTGRTPAIVKYFFPVPAKYADTAIITERLDSLRAAIQIQAAVNNLCIFPGQSLPRRVVVTLQEDDLEVTPHRNALMLQPYIFGELSYHLVGGSEEDTHRTVFFYQLFQLGRPLTREIGDPWKDIPANKVEMAPAAFGWYAD